MGLQLRNAEDNTKIIILQEIYQSTLDSLTQAFGKPKHSYIGRKGYAGDFKWIWEEVHSRVPFMKKIAFYTQKDEEGNRISLITSHLLNEPLYVEEILNTSAIFSQFEEMINQVDKSEDAFSVARFEGNYLTKMTFCKSPEDKTKYSQVDFASVFEFSDGFELMDFEITDSEIGRQVSNELELSTNLASEEKINELTRPTPYDFEKILNEKIEELGPDYSTEVSGNHMKYVWENITLNGNTCTYYLETSDLVEYFGVLESWVFPAKIRLKEAKTYFPVLRGSPTEVAKGPNNEKVYIYRSDNLSIKTNWHFAFTNQLLPRIKIVVFGTYYYRNDNAFSHN